MRTLAEYYWRQNLAAFWWTALALLVTAWLLAAPLAPLKDGVLKLISESPLLQKFGAGLMGIDLQGELTIKLLAGSTWSHPFLFALLWGYAVSRALHFPVQAGEDGTIDFLYALPFSRQTLLSAQSFMAVCGLSVLQGVAIGGFLLGSLALGQDALTFRELLPVSANLFCTSLTMLALGSLTSVVSKTKASAAGVAAVFGLWSLLLGYLKPILTSIESFSPLGLLHYYRPGEILQSGHFPAGDCLVLLTLAGLFWAAAHGLLRGRDLV